MACLGPVLGAPSLAGAALRMPVVMGRLDIRQAISWNAVMQRGDGDLSTLDWRPRPALCVMASPRSGTSGPRAPRCRARSSRCTPVCCCGPGRTGQDHRPSPAGRPLALAADPGQPLFRSAWDSLARGGYGRCKSQRFPWRGERSQQQKPSNLENSANTLRPVEPNCTFCYAVILSGGCLTTNVIPPVRYVGPDGWAEAFACS